MNEQRFEQLLRTLGASRSRRGALATLAGLGLAVVTGQTKARKPSRKKRRQGRSDRVVMASVQEGSLIDFGKSDAESILLLAFYDCCWPLWDHADLTARVKAIGEADPALVAAVREAVSIWAQALDTHFQGLVTLTDVTDDHHASIKADIHVRLSLHRGGFHWTGIAICGDDDCKRILVKSEFSPGQFNWPGISPEVPREFSPDFVTQVTLHELGHALGLGHASPRDTSNDLMGYGWIPWWNPGPDPIPVLSTCDLRALEEVFAWRLEGTEPRRPSIPEVVCKQ